MVKLLAVIVPAFRNLLLFLIEKLILQQKTKKLNPPVRQSFLEELAEQKEEDLKKSDAYFEGRRRIREIIKKNQARMRQENHDHRAPVTQIEDDLPEDIL